VARAWFGCGGRWGVESVHGMIVRYAGPMICKGRAGLFGAAGCDFPGACVAGNWGGRELCLTDLGVANFRRLGDLRFPTSRPWSVKLRAIPCLKNETWGTHVYWLDLLPRTWATRHQERGPSHPSSPVPKCKGPGAPSVNIQFSEIVATRLNLLHRTWATRHVPGSKVPRMDSCAAGTLMFTMTMHFKRGHIDE